MIDAIQDAYPKALIQFEDFATPNAYALLKKYRDKVLCFNDDIQGTAAVALAGIYASTRISGVDFKSLRFVFLGAGSAATGIGDLIVEALVAAGSTQELARKQLWFVDINGLITHDRIDELLPHNLPYAHDHQPASFIETIQSIKPHILIGATGAPGTFTQEVISLMAKINQRPTIFALSNPTSKAECTAQQAYEWSHGRAIFASGSRPFAEVEYQGQTFHPGQGNNAYIFPGIGLGAIACEAKVITESIFLTAAKALADQLSHDELSRGSLYPALKDIRQVSLSIAVAVADQAFQTGLAQAERPDNLEVHIKSMMYDPDY